MVDETVIGNATVQYGPSNPHPGHGKDKNIGNEYGHTIYPKYVKNAEGNQVIVNSEAEEAEAVGDDTEKEPSAKTAKKPNAWGK